ncbi:hypothetical protein KJ570_01535 [Patescibacteria group bacterium]|nr:hypothetical protein [Patescibacteria group bacterium]MBU2036266.1 hypothetical protein [Patescibacteria group bacterium]
MKKRNILGQSLMEVVLALGLITLIMVTVVAAASISITNSSFSKNQTFSTRLSETTLEWLRGERDNSWDDFSQRAESLTWCLPELNWDTANSRNCNSEEYISDTFLKREVDFSLVDQSTIEVTVRIYWIDAGGYHEINSSTYLTNWH